MPNYKKSLMHGEQCFKRETLTQRMQLLGLKNIVRMELFLWDLEIFLQIQNILKERIALKGGAAVQFYIPVEYQRTSIDIDMVFSGTKEEIMNVLRTIEEKLGADDNYFRFREHIPKNPKTELPLYTFFVPVPSACLDNELIKNNGKQEIKVEFISYPFNIEISKLTGREIFAVDTVNNVYNVLSINNLFADKLTTIGPNTIGIQFDRFDELVKQLFDINALLRFNIESMDFSDIKNKYLERAQHESESRGLLFNKIKIIEDALSLLNRITRIDDGDDKELKKYIDDFHSSYLGKAGRKTNSEWAIVGEQIKYLMESLFIHNISKEKILKAFSMENVLLFKNLSGKEKGDMIAKTRSQMIDTYSSCSPIDAKVLKGKSLNRIYWSILSPLNVDEIDKFIQEKIRIYSN